MSNKDIWLCRSTMGVWTVILSVFSVFLLFVWFFFGVQSGISSFFQCWNDSCQYLLCKFYCSQKKVPQCKWSRLQNILLVSFHSWFQSNTTIHLACTVMLVAGHRVVQWAHEIWWSWICCTFISHQWLLLWQFSAVSCLYCLGASESSDLFATQKAWHIPYHPRYWILWYYDME